MPQTIQADLTLIDGALHGGVQVEIGDDGVIARVERAPRTTPTRRLTRRMLLPGFVNAHSHAFQRALRGLGEAYPAGMGDFWSWREAMYGLVLRLTPETFLAVTRAAFDEMLSAGITTVGEFHYVHHADADALDFALDELVIRAAAESGIRLALLESYYKTGAVGKPLVGGQRRFGTPDVRVFLDHVDRIAGLLNPRTQTIGLAPHSLRAVPTDDVLALHDAALRRGWVCHMHVEEQRREMEEFRGVHGVDPLDWILRHMPIGSEFTMIHATHSSAELLDRYFDRGGRVCACPLTEGNLGDGLARIADVAPTGAVCLGTDSNVRIDLCEEARWLEFVQRLRLERRGAYKDAAGDVAPRLLETATRNGAASLGVRTGAIAVGLAADLIAIDLDSPALRDIALDALPAAFLLGGGTACVREVCVGGRWVRPTAQA